MAGRPTKYKPEYAEQAYKLCLLGHTDAELAIFFEVNEDTIHEWKKVHEEFSESISRGKSIADMEVVNSLYQGAMDRVITEQMAFKVKNQTKPGVFKEKIQVVDVQKVIPADFRNQQFWLKNRQKDKWRDKQEVEHSGEMGINWQEVKTYEAKQETDAGS